MFRRSPPSKMADKYAQNSVCFASACIAALLRQAPTRLFERDRSGITMSEAIARMIPGVLCSGARCALRCETASYAIHDGIFGDRGHTLNLRLQFPKARGWCCAVKHCFRVPTIDSHRSCIGSKPLIADTEHKIPQCLARVLKNRTLFNKIACNWHNLTSGGKGFTAKRMVRLARVHPQYGWLPITLVHCPSSSGNQCMGILELVAFLLQFTRLGGARSPVSVTRLSSRWMRVGKTPRGRPK